MFLHTYENDSFTDLVSDKHGLFDLVGTSLSPHSYSPEGIFQRSIPQLVLILNPHDNAFCCQPKHLSGTARKLMRDPTLSGRGYMELGEGGG